MKSSRHAKYWFYLQIFTNMSLWVISSERNGFCLIFNFRIWEALKNEARKRVEPRRHWWRWLLSKGLTKCTIHGASQWHELIRLYFSFDPIRSSQGTDEIRLAIHTPESTLLSSYAESDNECWRSVADDHRYSERRKVCSGRKIFGTCQVWQLDHTDRSKSTSQHSHGFLPSMFPNSLEMPWHRLWQLQGLN